MSQAIQITPTSIDGIVRYQFTASRNPVSNMVAMMKIWHLRSSTRKQLRTIDEEILHDIGIDRVTAAEEADKWFWQE